MVIFCVDVQMWKKVNVFIYTHRYVLSDVPGGGLLPTFLRHIVGTNTLINIFQRH